MHNYFIRKHSSYAIWTFGIVYNYLFIIYSYGTFALVSNFLTFNIYIDGDYFWKFNVGCGILCGSFMVMMIMMVNVHWDQTWFMKLKETN